MGESVVIQHGWPAFLILSVTGGPESAVGQKCPLSLQKWPLSNLTCKMGARDDEYDYLFKGKAFKDRAAIQTFGWR